MDMFETAGRQTMEAYVAGGYYIVKRLVYRGTYKSVILNLPKDWLDSVRNSRTLKSFLIDIEDEELTLTPYFDNDPYADNKFHMVKPPIVSGSSVGVILPMDWVQFISREKAPVYLLLDRKIGLMKVKPYYNSIPELEAKREAII